VSGCTVDFMGSFASSIAGRFVGSFVWSFTSSFVDGFTSSFVDGFTVGLADGFKDSLADNSTGSWIASLVRGGFVSRFATNVTERIVNGFVWSLEGIF
jgi:hypothetical protein